MSNGTSSGYAKLMNDAIIVALKNGVQVKRFQFLSTMHVNWVNEMIAIKNMYPSSFRVFSNETFSRPNICVIDPDSSRAACESMEDKLFSDKKGSDFQSARFYHGDKNKTQKMKSIVRDLIEADETMEYKNEDMLRILFNELIDSRTHNLLSWIHANSDKTKIPFNYKFDETVVDHVLMEHCK